MFPLQPRQGTLNKPFALLRLLASLVFGANWKAEPHPFAH
jgi:hypothetical protein